MAPRKESKDHHGWHRGQYIELSKELRHMPPLPPPGSSKDRPPFGMEARKIWVRYKVNNEGRDHPAVESAIWEMYRPDEIADMKKKAEEDNAIKCGLFCEYMLTQPREETNHNVYVDPLEYGVDARVKLWRDIAHWMGVNGLWNKDRPMSFWMREEGKTPEEVDSGPDEAQLGARGEPDYPDEGESSTPMGPRSQTPVPSSSRHY